MFTPAIALLTLAAGGAAAWHVHKARLKDKEFLNKVNNQRRSSTKRKKRAH